MKILHVIESLRKNAGGAAEIVPVIAEEERLCGNGVTMVTLESADYSETAVHAQKAGVKIVAYRRSSVLPGILGFSWAYMKELDGLITSVDVVHVHGLWQFFGWWAALRTRHFGKVLVMQPHGSLEPERLKISRWRKRIVGTLVDRPLLRNADCVLTTAESEREHVIQYGIAPERVRAIPLGLHSEPYLSSKPDSGLLARLGVDVSKKLLLYFSRITQIKGLDMLAEVWRSLAYFHDEWQLVIAGPDDRGYTEEMRSLYARLLPAGTYVFTGPVYGKDKFSLLKSVHAFVLPTRSENFSIAVAEAMASGLPVVCTKGAPWGIVEKAHAGYWVDINVNALNDGLRKVLGSSPDERVVLGKNGQECVAQEYEWTSITKSMTALYGDLRRKGTKSRT